MKQINERFRMRFIGAFILTLLYILFIYLVASGIFNVNEPVFLALTAFVSYSWYSMYNKNGEDKILLKENKDIKNGDKNINNKK